jgi:hypothetical protein
MQRGPDAWSRLILPHLEDARSILTSIQCPTRSSPASATFGPDRLQVRDRSSLDSLLEQSGFEPSVPDGTPFFWRPAGTDLPGTQVREQQNLHHATEILIEDKASATQLIRVLIADGGGGDRRAKPSADANL